MTDWPRLTIALLTYEDGERNTAQQTLMAALSLITYSGDLAVHIADDGSIDGHVDALREGAGGFDHVVAVGATNVSRRGYGASYNAMTQAVHEAAQYGVVLVLEDDWVLSRPLDLDPLVLTLLMGEETRIAAVRLGYVGFTQRLQGEFVHTPGGIMVLIDPESDEPHVAAGHPRLETVRYQRAVGPWTEGLAPGATEVDWCTRPEARQGVAWPLDLGPASMRSDSLFAHIGSHGLGELEPEHA